MAKTGKIPNRCIEKTTDLRIVFQEKGKKITFLNKRRIPIRKITVDGCAITAGIRCDYLVLNNKDDEFFIELKGADVKHACDQLLTSIGKLSASPNQKLKYSFIISSRIAPAINTTIQNLKAQFKKGFNCILVIKNQQIDFEL
jgi:hypothetical protein